MKPYQILMAVALAGAAGLALFGDNSSSGDIAEPVARAPGAAAPAATPRSTSKDGKPQVDAAILPLIPRAQLVGESGEATFASGEGVFMGQNWNPPPPPPLMSVTYLPLNQQQQMNIGVLE